MRLTILRVAGLEFDQFLAHRLPYFEVACRFFIGLLVDANQFRDRIAFERSAIEQIFPAVDHHPELGAPIADVIVANDVVAEKGGDPRERVTQDGAANVADVHRLGDIRGAEVDDDAFLGFRARNAEAFVAEKLRGLRGNGFVAAFLRTIASAPASCAAGTSCIVVQYFFVKQGILSGSRVIISRLN